jgi:hypothetical protein
MNKESKNVVSNTMKKAKINLIRLCIVIITVVVVYFCYLLTVLLMNMNEKLDNVDSNLQIMVDQLDKTSKNVEKTEKKIQDSWIL